MLKCTFPYKENDPDQFRLVDEPVDELLEKAKQLRKLQVKLEKDEDAEVIDKANLSSYLGIVHFKLGHYETSRKHHESHLSLAQELGDRKSQGGAYTNLGCVYRITGRLDQATDCFEKALQLAKDRGDRKSVAKNLNNLGNIYELRGYFDEAIECYEERLGISRSFNDLDSMCKACASLGGLYRITGDLLNGIARYEELVETLRTKLRIQVLLADDSDSSDDELDLDEIAYEIQRERLEALKRFEDKTVIKTSMSEKLHRFGDNVAWFFKSLVKR